MKAFRRFARARRGSAAVEFALVLMPFFLLTFGLAEVSMIGFAQTSLDFAVSETARQIRTGQAQTNGVTEAQIRTQLCSELNNFISISMFAASIRSSTPATARRPRSRTTSSTRAAWVISLANRPTSSSSARIIAGR
jgi:Flp pilus assembly protein TadG